MKINIEPDSVVLTIGAMGTGKSTFVSKKFAKHHIVSTDHIREELCGDFEDQSVNKPTFEILFSVIEARAKHGLLTVVDSTGSRSLLERGREICKKYNRPMVALIFPHLNEDEITQDRMQHRMRYIHAYYKQVKRINETNLPDDITTYVIPKNKRDGVSIHIIDYEEQHTLDPNYNYLIVGDLHGEYRVLEKICSYIENNKDYKIIQLGDIVDRGESSYKTFKLIQKLRAENKLFSVASNHDDKLTRYFRKWKVDTNNEKFSVVNSIEEVPTYGMKISHGIGKTLVEFYNLSKNEQIDYANGFIEYYESLPSYLKVERLKETHIFTHAGFTEGMIVGDKESRSLRSKAIYGTVYSADEAHDIAAPHLNREGKDIIFHVGHNYVSDVPKLTYKGKVGFYQHDIGIGKRSFTPKFEEFVTI